MSRPIPTIRDYMAESPHTIGSDQPVAHASELMQKHHIRHLPVLEGGRLVGVISDRDVKIVQAFHDVDAGEVQVAEAVGVEAYTVAPDAKLDEVAMHMAEHKYGSAVVMDHNKVIGIFTTVDALRALADALRA
jgi:acetoin utilization protein AcuB